MEMRRSKGQGKGIYHTGEEEAGDAKADDPNAGVAGGSEDGAEWGATEEDQWWMGSLNQVSREDGWEELRSRRKVRGSASRKSAHTCHCPHGECRHEKMWQPSYFAALMRSEGEEGQEASAFALLKEEPGQASDKIVCALAGGPKGRLIEAVIDSGAEESVAPPKLFPGKVEPSEMSKAGKRYKAANGTRIPNLGQLKVSFQTAEGHRCGMPFQVAEVEKPLIAVSQLAAAGNTVTLEKDSGTIRHNITGKTIKLDRRGGVYTMKMCVSDGGASDFPRPGR